MRAGLMGELHREGTDAAGGAVDQNLLALDEAGVVEQHLPGRHRDHRDGSRLKVVERRGLGRDPRHLGKRVVGVGAGEPAIRDAIHLLAEAERRRHRGRPPRPCPIGRSRA